MRIKRFEAFEVSEALAAIKKEMGPDAVILSTREIRKGPFGLLSRRMVEVTAACDPAGSSESEGAPKSFQTVLDEAERPAEVAPGPSVQEEIRAIREVLQELGRAGAGEARTLLAGLRETCSEMKGILGSLAHSQRSGEVSGAHQNLISQFDRLLMKGVDPETSTELFRMMKKRLAPEEVWREDFVRSYLKELIKGMVRVASPLDDPAMGKKGLMVIGPTGVGKTTTIAKMAAKLLEKGRRVTLATLDAYRVGAVDQLKAYGRALGAPVEVMSGYAEFRDALLRTGDGRLLLVDTPGGSHLNREAMGGIGALSGPAKLLDVHLVVSSNTKGSDLEEIVDRFSTLSVDGLLFTKLDETRTYGQLLSVARRTAKPLSYFSTGQRVPEDIEPATPKKIADLILNEEQRP